MEVVSKSLDDVQRDNTLCVIGGTPRRNGGNRQEDGIFPRPTNFAEFFLKRHAARISVENDVYDGLATWERRHSKPLSFKILYEKENSTPVIQKQEDDFHVLAPKIHDKDRLLKAPVLTLKNFPAFSIGKQNSVELEDCFHSLRSSPSEKTTRPLRLIFQNANQVRKTVPEVQAAAPQPMNYAAYSIARQNSGHFEDDFVGEHARTVAAMRKNSSAVSPRRRYHVGILLTDARLIKKMPRLLQSECVLTKIVKEKHSLRRYSCDGLFNLTAMAACR
jgi:hypothetical protein